MLRMLYHIFWRDLWKSFLLYVLYISMILVNPTLLNLMVNWVEDDSKGADSPEVPLRTLCCYSLPSLLCTLTLSRSSLLRQGVYTVPLYRYSIPSLYAVTTRKDWDSVVFNDFVLLEAVLEGPPWHGSQSPPQGCS